jgi:hypothetical protein
MRTWEPRIATGPVARRIKTNTKNIQTTGLWRKKIHQLLIC